MCSYYFRIFTALHGSLLDVTQMHQIRIMYFNTMESRLTVVSHAAK